MKQNELDQKTFDHFRWRRMIASEREEMAGTRTAAMMNDPAIILRDKTAEKGRVRRIKVKVLKLLNRPRKEWKRFVGPEWVKRLVIIKALQQNQTIEDHQNSISLNSNDSD